MGLFSKIKGKVFSERDLEFNRQVLQKSIIKLSEDLYNYRNDTAHAVFSDYLRSLLNLEILQLSERKLDAETFAYQRGRIEALRHVLNLREKFIQDKKQIRDSKDKNPTDHEAKRSYVRPHAVTTAAGLSI